MEFLLRGFNLKGLDFCLFQEAKTVNFEAIDELQLEFDSISI